LHTSLLADIDETKTLTGFCSASEDMLDAAKCGMFVQQQQQLLHQQRTSCQQLL